MSRAEPAAAPATPRSRAWWVWLFAAVVVAVWFGTLDARHLLRSDEGRYAEIAREMFVSGDWVTIRYNGLKYFEKPPFHLWMTVLAYHAFGVGDWQARLWVAASGAIGTLAMVLAARRWFGARVGWLTALVLIAAPSWNLGAHFNSLDMSVSGALACVLAAFMLAQHPDASAADRRRWMWAAWAAMAVATLTKGLIGFVLPGLVLVLYTLLARDWSVWRRLHLVTGSLLILALAAPWFVLISLRNPEFPQFFFIHEHWDRYTSTIHHRMEPWWYFVPQLVGGFLPWIGLTPRVLGLLRADAGRAGFRPLWWLATWAAAIFVFFSLSDSKLPGYILPVFPALAVLAALALDRLDRRAWNRQLLVALIVALAALAASPLVARLGNEGTPNVLYRHYMPWIAAACALAVIGILAARRLARGDDRLPSIAAFSLAIFGAVTIGLAGHETLGRSISGVDLVAPIKAWLKPGMPIYSVRLLDHTLPFYLRHTTIMVEAPDELAFGVRQEPDKWIPTLAGFEKVWTSGAPALAIMSHDTYAKLVADRLPMFAVAEDTRRVVVANFARPSP
ncbi:MAG: 4-amino-4-deoxy-L-arabinose transferase [Rubrivivax sp. SCN 70-15]|nr:MAG: 4-amino-4-deoxy-L-arabinose transferase [Rubrivivax sp. SCN 70-15]